MRLVFYRGPGDLITRIIRLLTYGPYSHVELQFTNGDRFFSSGHGEYQGVHIVGDSKVYGGNGNFGVITGAAAGTERHIQFSLRLRF